MLETISSNKAQLVVTANTQTTWKVVFYSQNKSHVSVYKTITLCTSTMYRVKVSWKVNEASGSVIQDVPFLMPIKDHFEGIKSSIVENIDVRGHRKLVKDLVLFTKDKKKLDMNKTFEEIFHSHDKSVELELFTDFNPKRSDRTNKRKRED